MTTQIKPDPKQALAGMMGGAAPQPMKFGSAADVDPLVRFDQKTSGRANKATIMSGAY
jgi:hypothetical protein